MQHQQPQSSSSNNDNKKRWSPTREIWDSFVISIPKYATKHDACVQNVGWSDRIDGWMDGWMGECGPMTVAECTDIHILMLLAGWLLLLKYERVTRGAKKRTIIFSVPGKAATAAAFNSATKRWNGRHLSTKPQTAMYHYHHNDQGRRWLTACLPAGVWAVVHHGGNCGLETLEEDGT